MARGYISPEQLLGLPPIVALFAIQVVIIVVMHFALGIKWIQIWVSGSHGECGYLYAPYPLLS